METITSPVIKQKQKDIPNNTMSFYKAIRKVIEGKKIHKLEWGDRNYYGFLKDKVLLLHKPDGKDYQWILSLGDLEGDGYIVL